MKRLCFLFLLLVLVLSACRDTEYPGTEVYVEEHESGDRVFLVADIVFTIGDDGVPLAPPRIVEGYKVNYVAGVLVTDSASYVLSLSPSDNVILVPEEYYDFSGALIVYMRDSSIVATALADSRDIDQQISELHEVAQQLPGNSVMPVIGPWGEGFAVYTYYYCLGKGRCLYGVWREQFEGSTYIQDGGQYYLRTPGHWARHDLQLCPVYVPISDEEAIELGLSEAKLGEDNCQF